MNVRYGLMPLPYLPYSQWTGAADQRPEGFIVDLIMEIGVLMKWNLTFVPMGPLCEIFGPRVLMSVTMLLGSVPVLCSGLVSGATSLIVIRKCFIFQTLLLSHD